MHEPIQPVSWAALGAVSPLELVDARLALHYAVQPMAAAAYAVLPMRADHSHTNLLWSPERRGFVGRELTSGQRCFLDPTGLRTGLVAPNGEETSSTRLEGETLGAALAAMASALRDAGETVPADGLSLPEYDLPDSPIAQGAPFLRPDSPAFGELAAWFHDGALALERVASSKLADAEVRCWPHHFDFAALLTLDPGADPETARSVGAGFSPGDGSYAEPYFYVSPWPYPPAADLPELPAGARWHTEGFTAAVLSGSELAAAGEAGSQADRASEALGASIDACLALLG